MLKRFTDAVLILLAATLGACSSVPFVGSDPVEGPSPGEGVAQQSTQVGGEQIAMPVVETPPLKAGNQALFDRAVTLLKDGQLQDAQVLFEELTASQPELAGPWVNLGHIHLAGNDSEAALTAFKQALNANPHNCDALNQLGVLARREGRFADAEQYYLQCLTSNPGYTHARLNLGILYELYMGRLGDALAAYHDYQGMLTEPDSRVNGWVMDLERRVAAVANR